MKGRIIAFVFTLLSVTLLFNTTIAQQSGWLTGTITDGHTNEPLPGATVYIKEYNLGTTTDLNGGYTIQNIPATQIIVTVSYIGFETENEEITIVPGQRNDLDVQLMSDIETLSEFVVTAQARGQLAAINQQLSADQMKNVVSAERIQDVPDANAAESIARLPGISLRRSGGEGTNVNIRGLSPEFNKVTINGVTVPSTGENTRTSDLSMIASENLSGIEVFKSITPDMDGDAIGGTVNMKIAKAQDIPNRFVRLYGGYNAQERDPEQYRFIGRWSQRVFNDKLGIQASINSELRNRSADGLTASYDLGETPDEGSTPLILEDVNLRDTEEYRRRNGANLILDFSTDNWDFMLFNAYNSTQRDINVRQFQFDKSNQNTKSVISNPERILDLMTNMFTAEYNAGFAQFDWTLAHSNINNQENNNNTLDFVQLGTEIPLGIDYLTIHPADLMQRVVPDNNSFVNEASHDSYSVNERNYMADMNIKIPYRLGNILTGEIKFGGRYKINNRGRSSVSGDWLVRLEEVSYPIQDFFDNTYDPGNFLDGQTSIGLILDPSKTNDFYNKFKHNYSINDFQAETYSAEDRIGAGYLMTKMQIGRMVTFIPGLRYEQFNGTYTGEYRFQIGFRNGVKEERTEEIIHRDWLPMVNLIIRPTDWFNARFAVTKTLVRPGYNDLLPRLSLNMQQANDRVRQGNPGLEPTRSWNYDAYLTFNQKHIGFFTIGAFYKQLEGVIINIERFISSEELIDSLGLENPFYVYEGTGLTYVNRRLTRPENSGRSYVRGVELDWQTNLRYLPSPFNGIVFSVNYTRLWSNTFYPYFLIENIFDPTQFPPFYQEYFTGLREGRVRGQSDHIVNLSLGYDFKGLSARLSMTYQGESLSSVSTQPEKDRFNNDWIRWDLSLKQRITQKLSLYFNGSNLNNQFDSGRQGFDSRPTYLEYYGEQYELGLQLNF